MGPWSKRTRVIEEETTLLIIVIINIYIFSNTIYKDDIESNIISKNSAV